MLHFSSRQILHKQSFNILKNYFHARFQTVAMSSNVHANIKPLHKVAPPEPDLEVPLIAAVVNDDVDALKKLADDLNDGAWQTMNLQHDVSGNSALIWAADLGKVACAEFLANDSRVDLLKRGFLGNTALSRAARRGHVQIAKILLDAANKRSAYYETAPYLGGSVMANICNDKLQYPMHFAGFKKHVDVVKLMLEYHCCSYVRDRKGRTPKEDTSLQEVRDLIDAARKDEFSDDK